MSDPYNTADASAGPRLIYTELCEQARRETYREMLQPAQHGSLATRADG